MCVCCFVYEVIIFCIVIFFRNVLFVLAASRNKKEFLCVQYIVCACVLVMSVSVSVHVHAWDMHGFFFKFDFKTRRIFLSSFGMYCGAHCQELSNMHQRKGQR